MTDTSRRLVVPDAEPAEPRPAEIAGPGRAVGVAWGLLVINTLGYTAGGVLPFPKPVAQILTMGALAAAFGVALLCNPRVRVRPNAYLLLLSMLVVVSLASSLQLTSGYGSLLRCARLVLFVATLWLLSTWWRGDQRFAIYHVRALGGIVLVVLVGLVVAPQTAFGGPDGRLVGALWPIPSTQVGFYCAIATGLVAVLWAGRRVDLVSAVVVTVPAVTLLLLSHTRTALLAMAVGLVVAGLSLWSTERRARRGLAALGGLGVVAFVVFGAQIQTWLERGQDTDQLTNLTGRTKVWDQLLAQNRTLGEQFFGVGLTDKSFGGLSIDNAWLATFQDQGWIGVALVVAFMVALVVTAILRPPSVERALALFLVVYCLVASYTEVGLGDASPYLLSLAVATSLLVVPARRRTQRPDEGQGTRLSPS